MRNPEVEGVAYQGQLSSQKCHYSSLHLVMNSSERSVGKFKWKVFSNM